MGLDMYLYAQRVKGKQAEEAREKNEEDYAGDEIGYWRKHPNLHGYIVREFAGGDDKCQVITLDQAQIEKIIAAIKSHTLPKTEGFFFGASDGAERPHDLKIFKEALEWLKEDENHSVYYQASW